MYIAVGGLVSGAATATPIVLVGSTGVFVAAGVYHSFIAAKRGVSRAFLEPKVGQLEEPEVRRGGDYDIELIEDYRPENSENTHKEDKVKLLS